MLARQVNAEQISVEGIDSASSKSISTPLVVIG
jgi:hypothetical protein